MNKKVLMGGKYCSQFVPITQ